MASEPASPMIRFLRQIAGPPPGRDLTDRHLLERFVRSQDQAAFAALVQRHGPQLRQPGSWSVDQLELDRQIKFLPQSPAEMMGASCLSFKQPAAPPEKPRQRQKGKNGNKTASFHE